MDKFAVVSFPLPTDRTFHYILPSSFISAAQKGMRVLAPLGKNQTLGYLVDLDKTSPVKKLKEITRIIDTLPAIDEKMLQLARWMSQYYLCSWGEAIKTVDLFPLFLRKKDFPISIISADTASKPYAPYLPNLRPEHLSRSVKQTLDTSQKNPFLLWAEQNIREEFYFEHLEYVYRNGEQSIFLLPEASRFNVLAERLKNRFGSGFAFWHSRMKNIDKKLLLEMVKTGQIKLVVGTRSALFVPFPALKLIIVDEEESPAYKQDTRPYYNTSTVAGKLAELSQATLILGSAGPSLDTYWKTRQKEYQLLKIESPLKNREVPSLKIIDLTKESGADKKNIIFSRSLREIIEEKLKRKEKVLLFLNRRGFSDILFCPDCKQVLRCPQCAVPLRYHARQKTLQCRRCRKKLSPPFICLQCKNQFLRFFGFGTEKVEEEAKKMFAPARVVRFDQDTIKERVNLETEWSQVREKTDIVVGTQMACTDYFLGDISLVGVILAETGFYSTDFRSTEHSFGLLWKLANQTQKKEMVIQTYNPGHYSLTALKENNYDRFFEEELKLRQELGYPPSSSLVNLVLRGKTEPVVSGQAEKLALRLNNNSAFEVLGPIPAPRSFLRGNYRWQILLKGKDKMMIPNLKQILENYSLPKDIKMTVDVDPQDLT